jgi:hypothetical protein
MAEGKLTDKLVVILPTRTQRQEIILKPLSFRQTQFLWAAFILAVFVFAAFSEMMRREFDGVFSWKHWTIVGLGIYSVVAGDMLRKKHLTKSTQAANNGDFARAARSWTVGQLMGFSCAVNAVLWGIFANLAVGSPRWFDVPFYVVGLLVLLSYRPVRPAFA